jgi:hypothetical protein
MLSALKYKVESHGAAGWDTKVTTDDKGITDMQVCRSWDTQKTLFPSGRLIPVNSKGPLYKRPRGANEQERIEMAASASTDPTRLNIDPASPWEVSNNDENPYFNGRMVNSTRPYEELTPNEKESTASRANWSAEMSGNDGYNTLEM